MTMADKEKWLYVNDTVFPVLDFGSTQTGSFSGGGGSSTQQRPYGQFYVIVASADDQSLYAWTLDGSARSGRIEFRNYDTDGSIKTVRFTDAVCSSYQEGDNPDSPMLPRKITLAITPAKLLYEFNQV